MVFLIRDSYSTIVFGSLPGVCMYDGACTFYVCLFQWSVLYAYAWQEGVLYFWAVVGAARCRRIEVGGGVEYG